MRLCEALFQNILIVSQTFLTIALNKNQPGGIIEVVKETENTILRGDREGNTYMIEKGQITQRLV